MTKEELSKKLFNLASVQTNLDTYKLLTEAAKFIENYPDIIELGCAEIIDSWIIEMEGETWCVNKAQHEICDKMARELWDNELIKFENEPWRDNNRMVRGRLKVCIPKKDKKQEVRTNGKQSDH